MIKSYTYNIKSSIFFYNLLNDLVNVSHYSLLYNQQIAVSLSTVLLFHPLYTGVSNVMVSRLRKKLNWLPFPLDMTGKFLKSFPNLTVCMFRIFNSRTKEG